MVKKINLFNPLHLFPLSIIAIEAGSYFFIKGVPKNWDECFIFLFTLLISYGFWCLYLGFSKWCYQIFPWSFLFLLPTFIWILSFNTLQLIHLYLFKNYITPSRFIIIQVNWNIIAQEVIRYFHEMSWFFPILIILGLSLFFFLVLHFLPSPFFQPIKWKGLVSIFFSISFLVWLVFYSNQIGYSVNMSPNLSGYLLQKDLFKLIVQQNGGFLNPRNTQRRPSWLVDRQGTALWEQKPAAPFIKKPNIVFILLESIRADHLSAYESTRNTSPFLKELTGWSDVFLFKNSFSNASISYLSMISLTSGKSLDRKIEDFEQTPLIWDYLKSYQYTTSLITQSIGYPRYLLDKYLNTPGLDFYRDIGQESLEIRKSLPQKNWFSRRFLKHFYEEINIPRDDLWTLNAAQQKIQERQSGKPFFLLWELECTHVPYCYSDDFKKFEPAHSFMPTRKKVGSLINDYDNAILYTDDVIKRFFNFLKGEGLIDNTVVVIASDHGEAFYEHGQIFHGGSYYQEETRVPLIIYFPKKLQTFYAPQVVANLEKNKKKPVQLLDILPTLVSFSSGGKDFSDTRILDGHDLLSPLPEKRRIFITNSPPFPGRNRNNPIASSINQNLQQIINFSDSQKNETYNLNNDPKQVRNLSTLQKYSGPQKLDSNRPLN